MTKLNTFQNPNQVQAQTYLPGRKDSNVKPTPEFRFKHHPMSWGYSEEKGFYPILKRLFIYPGINNITYNARKQRQNYPMMIQGQIQDGFVVIEPNDIRLGQYKNYLRRWEMADGNICYTDIFVTPEVLGNLVDWDRNQEAYDDFLNTLITSGIIQPISKIAIKKLIATQNKVVQGLEGSVYANPNHHMMNVRYKTETRKLAGMKGEDVKLAEKAAQQIINQAKKAE